MPGYDALAAKKTQLIRKGLKGSVFIAPITSAAVDPTVLFDVTTGAIKTLPTGYADIGWITDVGAVFARKITDTQILGWGSNDPLRSDITADTTTLVVDAEETKLSTIALYSGVTPASITPATNGSFLVANPAVPPNTFYRVIVIAADSGDGGEIIMCKFLPRAKVSNYTSQAFANGKDPLLWGVEFTGYQDSVLGYASAQLYGGPGWLSLLDDMDFPHVVTATIALTTAFVVTTGTISASDVGRPLGGVGITPGTTLASFTDTTHGAMSAVGTIAGSGVAVTIGS
jgi:hypothetical protein